MKKTYELMMIFSEKSAESELTKLMDKLKKLIGTEGKVLSDNSLGKKVFAYPIKKEKEGIYRVLSITLPPSAVKPLGVTLASEPGIVRYLLTGKED